MRAAIPVVILLMTGCTPPTGQAAVPGSGSDPAEPSVLELQRLDRAAFKPGERLTLYGSGFDREADRNRVIFTGAEATAELSTAESLVVRVPAEARSGNLHVALGEQASRDVAYVVDAPEVATLSVSATSAGGSLVIHGRHFSPVLAENRVSFNGTFVMPLSGGTGWLLVAVGGSTGPLTVHTGAGASAPIAFLVIPPLGGGFNP